MSESPPTWTPSVITRALDKVLGTLLVANKPEVISYGANSEVLWKLLDPEALPSVPPCLRGESSRGLILVWDGTATLSSLAGRNTSEYLNPLTWALCAVKREPSLRIAVLDVDPARHSQGRFYQVVQAIDSTKRPFGLFSEPCPCVADVARFLSGEAETERSHAKQQSRKRDKEAVTKLLIHQVKAMLTPQRDSENDGHALANIVGPLVLMANRPTAKLDPTRLALKTLFRGVGLLGEIKEAKHTVKDSIFGERPVRLLLVDDQYQQGWKDWVESMVQDEVHCTVVALDKPDSIVDALKAGLDAAKTKTKSDCRFGLELPGCQSDVETILLLDLRLFSLGANAGKIPNQAESDFVREKLVPLCGHFPEDRTHAWPKGFPLTELVQADEWCTNPVLNSENHYLTLSFLPRLLALTDFSLPIIIFSSTGQRRIIQQFQGYGSIITDFEKPRFTGLESADLVEETEGRFHAALKKAAEWSQAAAKIRKLKSLQLDQYDKAKQAFADKKHIEIFHDECGRPEEDTFRVGTFAVAFPAEVDADRTDKYIADNGPLFYGPNAKPKITKMAAGRSQWANELAQPLSQALTAGNVSTPAILPFVVVSGNAATCGPDHDPFALLDPSGLDNANQDLLRLLVEVMLVDTLAWIAEAKVTCRVFGATRRRSQRITPELTEDAVRKSLDKRWRMDAGYVDVETKPDGSRFARWQTLRLDSLYGLLNELLSSRSASTRGMQLAAGIDRAYCTTLPTEKDKQTHPGYSHLHSIADILVRLVDINLKSGLVTWGVLETNPNLLMPVRGFAGLRDRIVRILNCHRALDESNLVDGFSYGLGVDYGHDVAGNVVAMRMRELIPRLTGDDFQRIVRTVTENGPACTQSLRLQDWMPRRDAMEAMRLSNERLEVFRSKWKVKTFEDENAYRDSEEKWHERPGFHVRVLDDGRVTVFAELAAIGDELPPVFVKPSDLNVLITDWSPCGRQMVQVEPATDIEPLIPGSNEVASPIVPAGKDETSIVSRICLPLLILVRNCMGKFSAK